MSAMAEFRNRTLESLHDHNSGRTYAEASFFSCHFQSSTMYCETVDIGRRTHVRDLKFYDCSHAGCAIKGCIIEEVLVENFKTAKMFHTWGTVFKHVTFKGRIGRVMLSDLFEMPFKGKITSVQRAFEKANAEYYSRVDWALDISQAEFDDFDCRGVPSRLVRRNPETQMMLTRERVLAHKDAIGAGGRYWDGLVRLFLGRADRPGGVVRAGDAIYIVPRKPPDGFDRPSLIAGISALRKAGVAEPD